MFLPRRGGGRLGDLSRRGLVAYNCGRRMCREQLDWATQLDMRDISFLEWLSDDEKAAWSTLLPSTWQVQWWRGWNDAASEGA